MASARRLVMIGMPLLLALSVMGCGRGKDSAIFEVSPERLRSTDATVQAQTTLEVFFNELASGDAKRANALVVPDRAPVDWRVDRLTVASITPVDVDPYGIGEPAGQRSGRYRAFHAPVRMWSGDGSVTAGEQLDWTWLLERGENGQWRIADWGY